MKKSFKIFLLAIFIIPCIALLSACSDGDDPQEPPITYDITVQAGESIQTAIDNATSGQAILVKEGTYDEQLIITKNITLAGEGEVVISGPTDYDTLQAVEREAEDTSHTGNMYALIVIKGATVNLNNITVKGIVDRATATTFVKPEHRYVGVLVYDSTANLENVKILDINSNFGVPASLFHNQTGYGIYVAGTQVSNLTVNNCEIKNFQKNGIDVRTSNAVAKITNTTIEGVGETEKIAQNGIVLFNTNHTITGNTFKNFRYTPGVDATDRTSESTGIWKQVPSSNSDDENTAIRNTLTSANKFENCQVNVKVKA